jgi:xanthine dehydrogenase accessory factor
MDQFETLLALVRLSQQADILTLVSAPEGRNEELGQMLVLPQDRQPAGFLVDETFMEKVLQRMSQMVWQQPIVITIDYNGSYRLFWEWLTPRSTALVLGAGHISQPLVELLASVGYGVTVVDDRPDFANLGRFPKAERVICNGFEHALKEMDIAAYTVIIVVTRGHRYDFECLRAVIGCNAQYIGMIGSQRRVRSMLEMLADEGFRREDIDRLRAPIGLDIGAQTPSEIALSIVSEVVAVNRGGSCLPLSSKRR